MKYSRVKTLFIVITLFFYLSNINAQKGFNLFFEVGERPIKFNYSKYDFNISIIDLNTNTKIDSLYKSISTENKVFQTNACIGLEYIYSKFALYGKYDFIFSGNNVNGSNIDFGLGYYFSLSKKFIIQPRLAYSLCKTNLIFGSINNKYGSLKVQDTKFYSDNIYVYFVSTEQTIKADLNIGYLISPHLMLKLYGGYGTQIGTKENYVFFEGEGQDGEKLDQKEYISKWPNVVTSDGNTLTKCISNQSGFSFGIGLTVFFEKQETLPEK